MDMGPFQGDSDILDNINSGKLSISENDVQLTPPHGEGDICVLWCQHSDRENWGQEYRK